MNKKVLLTGLLAIGMIATHAQPNFGKLKNKAGDVIKKDDKKEDVAPKAKTSQEKIDASPAAVSIRSFRGDQHYTKKAIEQKQLDDARERLNKLKGYLEKIKKDDPNWEDYSKDEADYLALEKQYSDMEDVVGKEKRLSDLDFGIGFISREPWRYNDHAERMDKANYEAVKKENEGRDMGDYNTNLMARLETFYKEKGPEIKKYALKDIKEKRDRAVYLLKETRSKPDYLKHFSLSSSPKDVIERLDDATVNANNALKYMPGDAELEAAKTQLANDKADIEQYVSSGQFDKDIATRKQMDIDERRVGKAMATDANLNAIVKRDMDKDNGTVYRISLTSRDWDLYKNDYDIPTKKMRSVDVVMKKDGKCYINSGWLVSNYEGGGRYGAAFFDDGGNLEMNCGNVDK